eukprot:1187822-Prorocentrum_minimum.AAC.1
MVSGLLSGECALSSGNNEARTNLRTKRVARGRERISYVHNAAKHREARLSSTVTNPASAPVAPPNPAASVAQVLRKKGAGLETRAQGASAMARAVGLDASV